MLSYSWDSQAAVLTIRKQLGERRVCCWMDVDGKPAKLRAHTAVSHRRARPFLIGGPTGLIPPPAQGACRETSTGLDFEIKTYALAYFRMKH